MKKLFLYIMAGFYAIAGINHFINPSFYLSIMPEWIPWHEFLVYLSGAVEIALGLLLIPLQTRKIASILIIAMLVVFFFLIHIPMAITFWQESNPLLWVALVRLPIQFVLIAWAWMYAK
ncbi:MAG TPA: DoxX family protein [Cyclobacteriaceae bacterium]